MDDFESVLYSSFYDLISKIEDLISKGKELQNSIYIQDNSFLTIYNSTDETEYLSWISLIQRLVKIKYPSELNYFEKLSEEIAPENHKKLLGLLNAMKEIPDEPENKVSNKEQGLHINITQSQNQQTNVSVNLIIEAFKSELNDNQRKEIQSIIDDKELEPEKKKSKIVETLKKFGGDVVSNILANILTNPSFFGFQYFF